MKQNITLVLLSVIATLLLVVVLQNSQIGVVQGQSSGGGSASVGAIGMATGSMKTGDSLLWLYLPNKNQLLVYELGTNKKLTFRGGRLLDVDVEVKEWINTGSKAPTREDVRKFIRKKKKK